MIVTIEIIAAPGCRKRADAQVDLRAIAVSLLGENNIAWREINVLEALDYAVSLGVLSIPAIAINGRLKFSSLPTPKQFKTELSRLVTC
ncbi:MAG: glutaredoxin [Ferrovum myxofaciens]|uniref:thioredoxin family protein n=1 Tax=Ferrovum myxofaciens TaxID=416213 RepID=UPI0023562984|nr:thioredoxin family protein [Ferrovum myxofaciens]QKE40280.1 MAG: glutaredoxin [Ferrovum myxofaciens]